MEQSAQPRVTNENTPMGSQVLEWLVRGRMVVVLVLLVITSTLLTENFIRPQNLVNVARQISFEAIIAFGMTLVIVTGGIDLSVGSMVALTGVVAGVAMQATFDGGALTCIAAGVAASVAVGALWGLANGAVVTRFVLPPFIVTLGSMLIARGFAFILCDGKPIYDRLPTEQLKFLGRGVLWDTLPVPVLLMAGAFVVFHVLLTRTVFGRSVIAVGSNEEAARLSGIAVRRTKLCVYVLTGALCGTVGVMHDGYLMAADPKVAEMWELNVIAAVVVGGTSLFGGRGTILGTLLGALIIGVLNNTLNLLHVQHFWQKVVLGAVILAAALLDSALSRLGNR